MKASARRGGAQVRGGSDYVMPSFEEPGGRGRGDALEEELDAEYFDTADLRLARGTGSVAERAAPTRAGTSPAARRRCANRACDGRSVEPAPVPRPLADLVAAYVRGEPLVPVARVRTHRRISRLVGPGGTVLAEIADDDVRGEAVGGGASAWRGRGRARQR